MNPETLGKALGIVLAIGLIAAAFFLSAVLSGWWLGIVLDVAGLR